MDAGADKAKQPKVQHARTAKQWDRLLEGLADADLTGKADVRDLAIALAKWGRGNDRALAKFPAVAAVAKAALQPPKPKAKAAK